MWYPPPGVGPWNHGGTVLNGFNTITNVNFVGGFLSNRIRFQGTATSVATATFGNEADIRITLGGNFFNWQNPGPFAAYTTFDYNSTQRLTGALLNADHAGIWLVQFYDSLNDDPAGVDSRSNKVTMTFERIAPVFDANGVFSASTLASNVQYDSQGEFAIPQPAGANGNNDRYTFNVATDGFLDASTDNIPGFTGNINGDTEIGIFDSAGNIVPSAFDNDGGVGLYSFLSGVFLTAGNYNLVVGAFGTNFSYTSTLSNLTFGFAPAGGYDYGVHMLFTSKIPEPSSTAILGLMGMVLGFRRRQRS